MTLAGIRFLEGKPWDERLKGLFEATAKVLAAQKPREPEKKKESVAAEPPRRPMIRTLRGVIPGEAGVE